MRSTALPNRYATTSGRCESKKGCGVKEQLLIFGTISLPIIAVPLVLLSIPQSAEKPAVEKTVVEKVATRATRTKTPRKVDEVQLNQPEQTHSRDDSKLRSGYYTMLLPRGFKWQVELQALGQKRYRLKCKRNLNNLGIYEIQGDLLVMVKPDDKRLTEFQWLITSNDYLKLVAEPHARKTGGNYLGTILTHNP